jgi:hypothetical protein
MVDGLEDEQPEQQQRDEYAHDAEHDPLAFATARPPKEHLRHHRARTMMSR